MMKLYDGGRAPNPRRVRVFLAEKGITVPAGAGRPRRAGAQIAGLYRDQPASAGAGAGTGRRHRHRGIDRDLPLFRGSSTRSRRCSGAARWRSR